MRSETCLDMGAAYRGTRTSPWAAARFGRNGRDIRCCRSRRSDRCVKLLRHDLRLQADTDRPHGAEGERRASAPPKPRRRSRTTGRREGVSPTWRWNDSKRHAPERDQAARQRCRWPSAIHNADSSIALKAVHEAGIRASRLTADN